MRRVGTESTMVCGGEQKRKDTVYAVSKKKEDTVDEHSINNALVNSLSRVFRSIRRNLSIKCGLR